MAVEIRILSGARKGERIVLEGTEFQVGDDSNCRIFFDPRVDQSARSRSVLFRLVSDGWRIESTGAGEVLLNQTAIVKQTPIRSGDLVRLSEFGPDFSFTVTSHAATVAVADSGGRVSTTGLETPLLGRAAAAVAPEPVRTAAVPYQTAIDKSPPPLPSSGGNRWISRVLIGATIAAVTVAGAILLSLTAFSLADKAPDRSPIAIVTDGDGETDLAPKPEDDESVEPDPPDEPEPKPPVEEDPLLSVPAAMFIVQSELTVGEESLSWPVCTGLAIGDHTIVTSGQEVYLLAELQRKGHLIWAINLSTGLKTAVRTLRVPKQLADLTGTPGDWLYVNLGLLVTEEELPESVSMASPDDLHDIEAGLPVVCMGYPHNGSKITSFTRFERQRSQGEIFVIDNLPGFAGASRRLELKAKIGENMYGSPILNQQGKVVAVYCMALPGQNVGVEDLHYATVLDHGLVRSWIEKRDTGKWVEPPDIEIPSPKQQSSPTGPN